ncbi:aminotransferase class V-fold PLP-dependent enzyme [Granulicella tundricola]|uniref:Aminotransferase class V n=1 Tax=Granulicella tundricola (strain ATCC BAA-1859 / DSM 23138 / MP5ACTX9) TaxID=1198114 RepID=E8WYU6_GRATM|nr:aminotransferase class V-fold PLP-dependent enzyme [Granulicella tundricola]ADW68782.1 aminotransferase class V [Granulicella tundricola MP5ACTX9]
MTDRDPLLKWRAEFPILEHTTYMISHSLGPMPRRAITALADFTTIWATRGIRAWEEGWWDMPVTCGNLIGKIIGAPEGRVIMHQNVSICQQIVTSCFDWSDNKRNKLVTDGLNFPSNDYIYHGLSRQGARIVSIPPNPDGLTVPLEDILNAIDNETQLVSISHVAFRSSALQDLAAITEKAHAVGAYIVADLYQSAGIVPLDVTALNVDFATGGSVKWLLGGPGAGYLYVRPDLDLKLQPANIGWAAHAHPFDFAPGPIQYAPDMMRYSNGTPNVPAMYSARSGYEIVAEIGVPAIRAKSQRQTQHMITLADAADITVRSPRNPNHRGGAVILQVPEHEGRNIVAELARRQILIDFRPGAGIRIAPHFYTSDDEIAHTITELKSILKP